MSELTLTLKNKKQNPSSTSNNESTGYSNLIKPIVTAGRGPSSTKNNSQGIETQNSNGRSYTQRVGAA